MRVFFDSTVAGDLLWDLEAPEGKGKDVLIDMRGHALTGQMFWIVTAPAGAFTLRPYSVSGTEVSADAYILGAPGTRFTGACAAPSRQVGSPGTASQAITVGSYDFNSEMPTADGTATLGAGGAEMTIGAISYYSNPGPRRMDAATKPEVTAPGQYHAACFPLGECGLDRFVHRDPSGKYAVTFNGTSAATPYCAGVIALALQKNPDLTFGQIRELLAKSARSDAFTGETPNAAWGFGKLDLAAVEALLESVPAK
jgi:subtilisin family serine protease